MNKFNVGDKVAFYYGFKERLIGVVKNTYDDMLEIGMHPSFVDDFNDRNSTIMSKHDVLVHYKQCRKLVKKKDKPKFDKPKFEVGDDIKALLMNGNVIIGNIIDYKDPLYTILSEDKSVYYIDPCFIRQHVIQEKLCDPKFKVGDKIKAKYAGFTGIIKDIIKDKFDYYQIDVDGVIYSQVTKDAEKDFELINNDIPCHNFKVGDFVWHRRYGICRIECVPMDSSKPQIFTLATANEKLFTYVTEYEIKKTNIKIED